MKIKLFLYTLIISIFINLTSNSQITSLKSFKIETYLPSHTYNKSLPPSFKIIFDVNQNIKGKLVIRLKKIVETNFQDVYEKKVKLKKGTNVFQVSENEFKFSKLGPEFYEIYSQLITTNLKYTTDTMTFVMNIDSIKYTSSKPEDFEYFWLNTFSKLESINPEFRLDTMHEKKTNNVSIIYKLKYNGLDSMILSSWYCIPNGAEKPPAILILPSYGNGPINIPYNFCEEGFATIALQIHGKDVENDTYPSLDDPSAGLYLDNPEKYYLRNAVAHIKRAVDFLYTSSEIDTSRIAVVGTSQGGGLALLITALDTRINVTAATIPTLISYPQALESNAYWRIRRAIKNNYVDKTTALNTLSYFDAINLYDKFSKPVLLSAHYKDRISPPNTIISFFNQLKIPNKQLIIQPEFGHQFSEHHWDITIDWLKMIFMNM